jgi:hypothetical protein
MTMNRALASSIVALASLVVLGAQTPDPSALLAEFRWRPIVPVNMGGRVDDIEAKPGFIVLRWI